MVYSRVGIIATNQRIKVFGGSSHLVSGLVHPSYKWTSCPHISHWNHQGELTHLRFVGWTTKYIPHIFHVWKLPISYKYLLQDQCRRLSTTGSWAPLGTPGWRDWTVWSTLTSLGEVTISHGKGNQRTSHGHFPTANCEKLPEGIPPSSISRWDFPWKKPSMLGKHTQYVQNSMGLLWVMATHLWDSWDGMDFESERVGVGAP